MIRIEKGMTLKPETIGHEFLSRQGKGEWGGARALVGGDAGGAQGKRQAAWTGDYARTPRYVLAPKGHHTTEQGIIRIGGLQLGRSAKPNGPAPITAMLR